MSKARHERLKQLEQEREYFYKQRNKFESTDPSWRAGGDEDYVASQQRIDGNSNGRHYVQAPRISEEHHSQSLVDDIMASSLAARNLSASASNSIDKYMYMNSHSPQKTRVDPFEKLVSKDHRSRQKYQMSDKNMLEDERARNAALEESYATLLRQVQQLQNTHLLDLRNSESRFHAASASLQKALISKSEELIHISNKSSDNDARYERESNEWHKERNYLVSEVQTLSSNNAESKNKIADRERRLQEMNKLRKELAERISIREQDLIKYGKALREREAEFVAEKDIREKLDAKVKSLEIHLQERDSQFRELQTQLHRKTLETEEFAGLKILHNETKRDLEDMTRREKYYNTEIEQMAERERKLFTQVELLTASERKTSQEFAKISDRYSALVVDLEARQAREEKLARDLNNAQAKNIQQESDLLKFDKQISQYQVDSAKFMQEFSTLQSQAQEAQLRNQHLSKELLVAKSSLDGHEKEHSNNMSNLSAISKELGSKTRQVEEQGEEITELRELLAVERRQVLELRQQSKEKFIQVNSRITELQDTLVETQNQLSDLRINEKALKAAYQKKEEDFKAQSMLLSETEIKIQEIIGMNGREKGEFEQFKGKKREEIITIQAKYNEAKQAMDSEVTQLRNQIAHKQNQYNDILDDFNETKKFLADLNSSKLSLDRKVTEMFASDANQQREISNLTNSVNQKAQELLRYKNKYSLLSDQNRRLEEEVALYRENNTMARDADINRLQNNMEEISKRLKTQVDVLIEKDLTIDSSTHGRSLSNSSHRGNSPIRGSPLMSPTREASSFSSNFGNEAENLERLLNSHK